VEFRLAVKGTKRIFDEPCRDCDRIAAKKAKDAWRNKMSVGMEPIDPDLRENLKRHARILMGNRWWSDWGGNKGCRLPDQNGCLELERKLGGTLSLPGTDGGLLWRDGESLGPVEFGKPNEVRLGVAKTKGKFRVVTMQSGRTKNLLKPVHEAAYDWISRFGWCCRGELTADALAPVVSDLREGESYVSGDYESATDNLNPDAVMAIVEVLAEGLPDGLAKELVGSFEGVSYRWGGKLVPIRRGSMMGNCVSFVVLCLLNKICHELLVGDEVESRNRRVRINGDDIVFCGSPTMYEGWRKITRMVGFVVNEEKTGFSREYLELNSQVWSVKRARFERKLNFGWLRDCLEADPDGGSVFGVCSQVSFKSAVRLLTLPLVRAKLENRELPVSVVPRRWWNLLVKRWWFRRLILRDRPDVKTEGVERGLRLVEGPPLVESWGELASLEGSVEAVERRAVEELVESCAGVACSPAVRRLARFRFCAPKDSRGKGLVLSRGPVRVTRMWLSTILEEVETRWPWLLDWREKPEWA